MKTLIWNIWSFWIPFINLKGPSQQPFFSHANNAFIVKLNSSYMKVILFEKLLQTRIFSFEFIARMHLYYRIFWLLLCLSICLSSTRWFLLKTSRSCAVIVPRNDQERPRSGHDLVPVLFEIRSFLVPGRSVRNRI